MNGTKRYLQFALPTVEAFQEMLSPLQAEGVRRIRLVGDNALATALAEVDWIQGTTVERSSSLSPGESIEAQAIVFTETAGEQLALQLLSCVELAPLMVIAPITDWHFSKKPLFLVSIPKAGTHLLYELAKALGYEEGVELPDFPKGQTWYCVEYTNSHTVAADFFVDTVRRAPFGNRHHPFMHSPTLFVYRHPLDILVSEAHYYHRDGKTAFAGWLSQYDLPERLKRLLEDNWLLGSLRDRVGGFLPWLEFPNVISFSFEELVGAMGGGSEEDQLQLIWSIQLKLQVPGNPAEIAANVFNPESPTFRSGKIGGYADHLSPGRIAEFAKKNADLLVQLGYPLDGTSGLPVQRKARRLQQMRYSHTDYGGMPLSVERDFLGFNLVRFRDRIYALPMAAGLVGLETAGAEVLAALPSGRSLNELKALLLIGQANLTRHRHALDRMANDLARGQVPGSAGQYWSEAANPCIIDLYQGFNIVAYRGRFFGVRLEVGPVDLTGDLSVLLQAHEIGDVLVAASLAHLYADIDGLSTAIRVRQEAVRAHGQTLMAIQGLEANLGGIEGQVRALREAATQEMARVAEAVVSERMLTVIRSFEEKQAMLEQRLCEQDGQLRVLQQNWAVRAAKRIAKAFQRVI